MRRVLPLVLGLATLLAPAAAQAADPRFRVSISRSAHGIPHIQAGDWGSLAYGYAYALAEDNVCVLADTYVTVRAERSRYFGPDQTYDFRSNGTRPRNLNSDFFYKRIIDEQVVEKLIAQPPPAGPSAEIREGVRGYVAGYNAYLRDVGADKLPDPTCRGKEWVKPIEEIDAYRRFYQLALLASSGVAIDGIGGATPPPGTPEPDESARRRAAQATAALEADPGRLDELLGGIGSNAYGLGKDGTQSGGGMVLGNPHFPWDGAERFYQAHLTLPKQGVDVAGGSLFGVPLILIGHTRGMAWSHTVSTARRFSIFEEKLVPGDPTSYLVDGQPRKMKATRVTVQARKEDGTLEPRTKILYGTEHGWVITSILGLPIFPWTSETAYTMGDANAANFRYLNHFFEVNRAQSVARLDEIERTFQGIPWVNTIAADNTGKGYYADIGSMPNLPNAMLERCSTPAGTALDRAQRLFILDGSRGACNWLATTAPGAAAPGILPPSRQPSMFRDDYTSNMNDSYWLTNPMQPLEGFDRVIGDERTARSPRTRLGLRIAQQRLDGSDGGAGKKFTLDQLEAAVFNNRQYLGELWRDELVAMCKSSPTMPSASGPVNVSEACAALEKWDLRDDLDSRGAILFRRFAGRALGAAGGPWREPFNVNDPVNTPRGLRTEHPQVRQALGDAVNDLKGAGIPFDAPLRDFQFEKRGEEKIPIHGGPGGVGVFNAINVTWDAKAGYPNVPHGSSYVQVVELKGRCPEARTILTYSQSTNPESPFFADQTRLFSQKKWVEPPFCDMRNAKFLRTTDLNGGVRTGRPGKLLRSVKVRSLSRRRGVRVTFRTARAARVTITLRRGTKTLRRAVVRRAVAGRTHRVTLRGRLAKGRYRLAVRATAGKRRHAVTRAVVRR